ncbi:unnamed protein product [Rotaria sp. Silwood1]|nr:unnamed protein product [Rotaria sp. Silwood1]CAF3480798.1 unnamed protein product [Rotaria sp. Silwood1]CAF4890205.1 unnamed protein product [Rotaria sp. Silwood1]
MSSSENSSIEILTNIPIYLHQYVATIFFIIGNIGNFLSIFIFFKKSWRKNVCVFYFVICLFNNTIFINGALVGSIFSLGFNINAQNSSVILCKLFYYIAYLGSTYLPCVLIFASIDRLLISSQNVDTRLYSSKRLAYFFVSTSLFVLSVFSLHILIKVNIQQFSPSIFICYYDLSISYLNFFIYSTLIISVIVPFILIILSIIAFKNVRHIRTIPRQQRRQIRSMNKKDFQLLRCLYAHNIVYIICTIVLIVSLVYGTTIRYKVQNPFDRTVYNFLNDFGSFLHYIPYCTSFFIFICFSKAFRLELKRYIYKICGKDSTTVREEENKELQLSRDNKELNVAVSTIVLAH